MSRFNRGDTVHQVFCVPANATIHTPRVYSGSQNVTPDVAVYGPTLVSGSSTTSPIYTVSFVIPNTAVDRQVYHLIIDWSDPSGDLQCPFMFSAQAQVNAATSDTVQITPA